MGKIDHKASLPGQLQQTMQQAFGGDLSDVRVHQGTKYNPLGARAYATGQDMFFSPGNYAPSDHYGKSLIGHELTHVVQQGQGKAQPRTP